MLASVESRQLDKTQERDPVLALGDPLYFPLKKGSERHHVVAPNLKTLKLLLGTIGGAYSDVKVTFNMQNTNIGYGVRRAR